MKTLQGWRVVHGERGVALVEFALVLPILLVILLGVIEFGRGFQVWLEVTHAASYGAHQGAVGASAGEIEAAVRNMLGDLDQASLSVSTANAQGTSGTEVSVVVHYDHTLLTGFFDGLFPDGALHLSGTAANRLE
jgi:Flp pilus assembly protein TadG